jgi:SAM-dependent methyltransferase
MTESSRPWASSTPTPTVLTCSDGSVEVLPLPGGRFRVTLKPIDGNLFIPLRTCETSLPLEIVADFLGRSFAWLCDSLSRHDDPRYVIETLQRQVLAYFDPSAFVGGRLLDFGCGSGASTLCMAALFPKTEVVGVELSQSNIELARKVLAARGLSNCSFFVSPDGSSLPAGLGTFDFAMLSAVYEHLLPDERRRVMPLIWSSLNPGGVLFVNQTPYRWFPLEDHTTGIWFINYLPDRLSLLLARRFSRHNPSENKRQDWNGLLRGGIRGGTEAEIISNLRQAKDGNPTIIQPREGTRAGYWLACTSERYTMIKKAIAALFWLTDKTLGTVPSMNLDVVIRKDPASPRRNAP